MQSPHTQNPELHTVTRALIPVVRGMCHRPDELVIRESHGERGPNSIDILVEPNVSDAGFICGKNGRHINALSHIAKVAFARHGLDGRARIEDAYKGERFTAPAFRVNPHFERDSHFSQLLENLLAVMYAHPSTVERIERSDSVLVFIFENATDVNAVADVFYPFGFRAGKKIKIRPRRSDTSAKQPATASGRNCGEVQR